MTEFDGRTKIHGDSAMRNALFAIALALAGFHSAPASDEGRPPAASIAAEATRVFKTCCATCHGPELAKPKGRFGYVLDLERIASNPEMVIPFRADESELLALIEH